MSDIPPPPPGSPTSDRLASVGQRAIAQVIDGLIIGLPLFIITASIGGDITDRDNDNLLRLTVQEVRCKAGDTVGGGDVLVIIA